MNKKKIKSKKNKKLTVSKLRLKLMKLWSEKVKELDDNVCIVCGKSERLNAHHLLSRDIKNCPLKYDIRNGTSLCPEHHKFSGIFSAHKAPIPFYDWFKKKYSDKYNFVLDNSNFRIDLDNRFVLEEIEKCLIENRKIDFKILEKIEFENRRPSLRKKLNE